MQGPRSNHTITSASYVEFGSPDACGDALKEMGSSATLSTVTAKPRHVPRLRGFLIECAPLMDSSTSGPSCGFVDCYCYCYCHCHCYGYYSRTSTSTGLLLTPWPSYAHCTTNSDAYCLIMCCSYFLNYTPKKPLHPLTCCIMCHYYFMQYFLQEPLHLSICTHLLTA